MSEPRVLRPPDIPQAMALKLAAGWNQTEEDWLRMLDLEPEGCFGIEREGRLVATTTAICYGRKLAWIGMVLTDPKFRGQGLATSLMRRALEFLDARGTQWVKLDATDMGKELYRKLGFVEECPMERWVRAPGPSAAAAVPGAYEFDAVLDLSAFGADRSNLISHLSSGDSVSIAGSGYAMGRPGSNAEFFGPCVANSPEEARTFVSWFVARHAARPIYWDLLPENRQATQLAEEFGFERSRRLVRMAHGKGPPLPTNTQQVYAIAGFEFG